MSKASCEKDVVVGRLIKKCVCISKESPIYMPYYGFQIMVCSDKNGMSYRSTESYKSLIQQLTEISQYGFPLKKNYKVSMVLDFLEQIS